MLRDLDWNDIPFHIRQKMLRKGNLLDEKGRAKRRITRQIKMMMVNSYYDQVMEEEENRPHNKRQNIITK